MTKLLIIASIAVLASCTVNVYDYSTHTGGGEKPPDTVFVEPGIPPQIPPAPDTVTSRRPLLGGGSVLTEKCGGWTRHTLFGCSSETDGASVELRPVVVRTVSSDGAEISEYSMIFLISFQDYMLDTAPGESFDGSSGSASVLPVVTGNELVSVIAGETTYPFLVEEAEDFDSDWLPGGTISCVGVFKVPDWKMRSICLAQQLIVSAEEPGYRLMFSDETRRLLQQFHDIFVIHGGEAPVLPVQADGIRADH